jgi:ketosteroid isomerase-like protein
MLNLFEFDHDGRLCAAFTFDVGDRRAACMELMKRSLPTASAAEGAAITFSLAIANKDFDALAGVLRPDILVEDRRRFGFGLVEGRDGYLQSLRYLLSSVAEAHVEPVGTFTETASMMLAALRLQGTLVDGGDFESEMHIVVTVDDTGRIERFEPFDVDDFDRARRRYEELAALATSLSPRNVAARLSDRIHAALVARDWEQARSMLAVEFVYDDRQPRALLHGGADMWIAAAETLPTSTRIESELLATLGERVAMERVCIAVGAVDASAELEVIRVLELTAEERLRAAIYFDAEERPAAFAEAIERFSAGEGACESVALFAAATSNASRNDFDAVRELLHDDFTFVDRRRLPFMPGSTPDDAVNWWRAARQLAPDFVVEPVRFDVFDDDGAVFVTRGRGTTSDGARLENLVAWVMVVDGGRLRRFEWFDIEDADEALARFEELRAPTRVLTPPNAAVRARDRNGAAYDARDWDALRELVTDDFVLEERRRSASVRGDVETFIATGQYIVDIDPDIQVERELLGTAGDRVAIERCLHTSPATDSVFETIFVTEVDEQGGIRAILVFEIDDRVAAFEEAYARFIAGEGAGSAALEQGFAFARALNRQNFDDLRATFHDEFAFADHRPTGVLPAGDADGYVNLMRTLADLASEYAFERSRHLAWDERRALTLGQGRGTSVDGATFVNMAYVLTVLDDSNGLIRLLEFYDVDDLDRARARFEDFRI